MSNYKMKGSHKCGECASFPICSKVVVKNVEKNTDCCQWEKDYYVKKA